MFSRSDLASWFSGGTRSEELNDTRTQWSQVEALWQASPLATTPLDDLAVEVMKRVFRAGERLPALPILHACADAIEQLLLAEDITALRADWPTIDGDVAVAVEVRRMLARRRRWVADFEGHFEVVSRCLADGFLALFRELPESCFTEWDTERGDALGVPLVELLERPAEMVERFLILTSTNETIRLDLFNKLRQQLTRNMVVASGYAPSTPPEDVWSKLKLPTALKGKTPSELVTEYLEFTPLAALFELPVPFQVPAHMRFEHCHIVGGTGHGKTQLMQRMIHDDLVAALDDGRSVVVIDSQGDMISKLVRLALFDSTAERSLADRLILIDPADIEYPVALNLFDAHLDRTKEYSAVDRERVLNGVVALYETFFGEMLGAELTQKQGVVFRYLARLMLTIPGANIQTLMQIMEDGASFKPQMARLEGSARHFFETEFFHPSFAATKKQILRRLWGVLSTPAFERMFVQPENRVDLFQAMNTGKIILVSTAKDLLKADGSALLGRFFIAMIAQAALERSVIPEAQRTPTFVYVDEAQEYFGDDIETILSQARKYRVGLTLAHQTLDQLSPRLRSALHSNTSLKFAGGVSAKDARALAEELHTTAEFVEGMRRRLGKTEFAAWLKGLTPTAIRVMTPLGFLEGRATLVEKAFDDLVDQNRRGLCRAVDDGASPSPFERLTTGVKSAYLETGDSAETRWKGTLSQTERYDPRLLGKGGRTHQYLQSLVKASGEQAGFKATVEAPLPGGQQIDVVLERNSLRIAFEVSVSTSVDHERANLRKCLDVGFEHIALVLAKTPRAQKSFAEAVLAALSPAEALRVTCLEAEEVPSYLAGFAGQHSSTDLIVSGYRVQINRSPTSADRVRLGRQIITRAIARAAKPSSTE